MIKLKDILNEKHVPGHDKEGKMAKFDAKETYQDAIDVFKMIDEYDDLPEWLEAKVTKAADYMNSVKDYLEHHQNNKVDEAGSIGGALSYGSDLGSPSGIDTGKKASVGSLQGFSDKEAKSFMDTELKKWAKDLRKVQFRVIKDWMKAAKAGKIDFFDIIRGLKTGDVRRAHSFEVDFLAAVLTRDKIIDRFRKYYGGKKGKKSRTK